MNRPYKNSRKFSIYTAKTLVMLVGLCVEPGVMRAHTFLSPQKSVLFIKVWFPYGRKNKVRIFLNGQFIIVYTCKPQINHKYSLVIITPRIFSSKMLYFGWWERSWLNLYDHWLNLYDQLKSGAVKLWIFSSKNLRHIFLDLRIISLLIFINLLTLNLLIIRFLTVYL